MAQIYSIERNGIKASGTYNPDGSFIVKKGTTAVLKLGPTYKPLTRNKTLQKELLESGILNGVSSPKNTLIFLADYKFNSPTQAADLILQRNISGPEKWINEATGKSLREEHPSESARLSSRIWKKAGRKERKQNFESKGWFRNYAAANECKERAKYNCEACELNFEETYGTIGKDFLEAHHKEPVSYRKEDVAEINADDLMALCSNCHRMIHRLLDRGEAKVENQLDVLKSKLKT